MSTASRATRSPNRFVTPRADTHITLSASARAGTRGCHLLSQKFFRRQAEALHPFTNARPLFLQESFAFGAQQSLASAGSHEESDSATIFDQSFVGQLLVRLQHGEMVDLVF